MRRFLHDFIIEKATGSLAARTALRMADDSYSYGALAGEIDRVAAGLAACGLRPGDRVAIWLEKRPQTIGAIFGASRAGGAFVPCNPVLKPAQIQHILADSGAKILITSTARLAALDAALAQTSVETVICIDGAPDPCPPGVRGLDWADLGSSGAGGSPAGPQVDSDMAAIFYTSGSTGRPKGVVLSHRNLVVGGESVAEYLGNSPDDRLLALLPLSFDAGFSQLTTGFCAGAEVVLHNYLLARDVPAICAKAGITGLTCVPPLWMQLLDVEWPQTARAGMRYFANTGGRMPQDVLRRLRDLFSDAQPYLMYGLTEAFRSTYLDPAELDRRPGSIGKAIPNAEIMVVRSDGALAAPGEEGELVHRGPLVSLGYWKDPERTALRFRPAPARPDGIPLAEMAVYSGDIVRSDAEGFLYFVGRNDDMIKTSGYRVSPAEVEEALFDTGLVKEAAAFGVAHPRLGQEIVVAVVARADGDRDPAPLRAACAERLPRYMVPARFVFYDALPRSQNGKIDRKRMAGALAGDGTGTLA